VVGVADDIDRVIEVGLGRQDLAQAVNGLTLETRHLQAAQLNLVGGDDARSA